MMSVRIKNRNRVIQSEYTRLHFRQGITVNRSIELLSMSIWNINGERICLSEAAIRKILFVCQKKM